MSSSYLVIARKWRPALFEEIVGQSHVTRTLRNAVSSGRIAHAYLFSGPRGVGKTTAARILAKCLNCASGPTATPCNSCESCKGIASGSSVDVFEIDGASNNSVDNVRELRESVRYVPTLGKYKVYLIDEVHMLSGSAFNALLKTLEEPPPHAIFIFATTEVHKIPATILSRCQRFDFKRIPFKDIQRHLAKILTEEGVPFEEQALFVLAREADGSLRDSQSLLEQVLAFSGGALKESDVTEALGLMDRSVLFELSEAMVGKDGKACLNIVEKVYDFGYDLKRACSDLLEHIRDLTVMKVTGDESLLDLPDSEIDRLRSIAARTGAERLHMLFDIVSRGYEDVSKSATPRFSFEMALLKAAHFDEIQPVESLLERLEGLASRLGTAPAAQAPRAVRPEAGPRVAAPLKPVAEARSPEASYSVKERAPEAVKPAATVSGDVAGFIEFVRKKNAELGDALAVSSIEVDEEAVNIVATGRQGGKLTINKGLLEGFARDHFKRTLAVRINGAANGGAEKKTEFDPLIKDAVRIFGGRVIEDRRRTTNVY